MSSGRMRSQTKPERFGALARLPLFFALQDKRAVIAGGSPAAAWKAELVAATGARLDVYAVDVCSEMLKLSTEPVVGDVIVHRRAWSAADLRGAALAIGDFRNDEEAAAFSGAARAAGVPVNVVDKPAYCDFSFGAIVNRSPLVVGISTDGAAPVFARAIRGKIEALLPKGFAWWTAAAARWRGAVKASGLPFAERRKFWQLFTTHAVANPDSEPRHDDFERFVAGAAGAGRAGERGVVTLIEADGSDPESLTLRAIRVLQSADVILFDEQISPEVLDFARREARRIRIGNGSHDKINALMVELGKQGAHVVRLKCRHRPNTARVPKRASHRAAAPPVPHAKIMAAS